MTHSRDVPLQPNAIRAFSILILLFCRDLRRVEYGDERDPKMCDFFETISPLNNAAKITKPMFIVPGRNDPRVPYTEGQQMTEALRKNSVPDEDKQK